MTILVFSKFLCYDVGGAEKSTIALLEAEESVRPITLLSVRNAKFKGKRVPLLLTKKKFHYEFLSLRYAVSIFPFLEYFLNRNHLSKFVEERSEEELWTYGILGVTAARAFQGRVTFFVRSETDLGVVKNYQHGLRGCLKFIQILVSAWLVNSYRRELDIVMRKAKVIANSKYMSDKAYELYSVRAEVVYPIIDVSETKLKLDNATCEKKYVVFVGDSNNKGLDIVMNVSRLMRHVEFKVISRHVSSEVTTDNLTISPWVPETWQVYRDAKMVIVPSQWEEAYGRVAREAYLLGIPLLVSSVGGLPEAVDWNSRCLVQDYRSATAWCRAIERTICGEDYDTK